MTTTELLELDAWIAEHVMGWTECTRPMEAKYPCFIRWGFGVQFHENAIINRTFAPTTDGAASDMLDYKILEKCGITGYEIFIDSNGFNMTSVKDGLIIGVSHPDKKICRVLFSQKLLGKK